MTQEEKDLLLIDLCARLPYGVKVKFKNIIQPQRLHWSYVSDEKDWDLPKPYLRPMSSMTSDEISECYWKQNYAIDVEFYRYEDGYEKRLDLPYLEEVIDFYNRKHLDWKGLIEKGLALEAPEGMYNTKNDDCNIFFADEKELKAN